MQLSGPVSGTNLVLGAADSVDIRSTEPYQSTGLQHARNLTGLYRQSPFTSGSVALSIQGQQYLSATQSVLTEYPSSISAVLRSATAWVDRVHVRVAYQVKDSRGSVLVTRPSAVVLRLTRASETREFSCDTSSTQSGYRVSYCSCTSLPASWFTSSGVASASVALRDSANAADVSSVTLPSVTLQAQPSWWDASLRTATVGSGLTAPSGVASSGGIFITLPASPLYANEVFEVYMYANTVGLALNTWRVRLYFSSTLVQYVSFEQSSLFNSASPSVSSGEVSWLATGVKSTTTDAQVTGSAIYLLKIRMRVAAGASAGVYSTDAALGLYPRATELISGAAFVENTNGQVFDARGTAQSLGQLEVVASSAAGIFAYAPSGTLANLEPLSGSTSTYPLAVVEVGSDDRLEVETSAVSGSSCSSSEPQSVLQLSGCVVELGSLQTASKAGASVIVVHNGFVASPVFDVYTPQSTQLTVEDGVLNRFNGASAAVLSSCSSGGRTAYPYQRTRVRAFADGLDAMPLVSFVTQDTSVAGVWSLQYDVIEGRQAGTTTAHLSGRSSLTPSVLISVSDTVVSASELVVRVVTGAAWRTGGEPSSEYVFGSAVLASAEVSNVMTAEGVSGRVFSRVVWSDGHEEDVAYHPASTLYEMSVTSGTSGVALTAPSGSERFWQAGVAVGALRECVTSVQATWSVCGTPIASGNLLLFLNLPDPVAARVTISASRLTAVGDDASRSPIGVPTTSAL